ncbi:MAG: YggS family pyridoxal phosphate-dependent enzyme [Burkholderiales bacterium]|jgi:pyridoxal phosphate enzyme (YggS family)|nr:YggS family pyridoxal phosphate-dependent enzyme [Burkholderiales bacterium]
MTNITQQIIKIRQELVQYTKSSAVNLIAVSKTIAIEAIQEAYHAAQQIAFGENYPQELASKVEQLQNLPLEWHFIGNIQSNKTKLIAENAAWAHTLANTNHAKRLNNQRPAHLAPLQVLIEVNISDEVSKHGLSNFAEIAILAKEINSLPNLKLRGLMGMASATDNIELIKAQFNQLKNYQQQLNEQGFNLDQLSMGMSGDYTHALECGATMIRIGSLIFGERNYDN